MPGVAIQKHPQATEPVWSMFEDMRQHFKELQERAFGLFEQRGGGNGLALDDWLKAERERFEVPQSELTQDDKAFRVRAAVPGLGPKDIEVTATPSEIVIRGSTSTRNNDKKGDVYMSEFTEKQLFRRYSLPAAINVDSVKANLEDGMITIEMLKAAPAKKVKVASKAA